MVFCNSTLTHNYLQQEAINAQLKMADSPNHTTVYIPSGSNGIPLVETLSAVPKARRVDSRALTNKTECV
jgi:hypothetical protein